MIQLWKNTQCSKGLSKTFHTNPHLCQEAHFCLKFSINLVQDLLTKAGTSQTPDQAGTFIMNQQLNSDDGDNEQ